MVPAFKRKFSNYIDNEKFSEILSIAQSMPGPIAINLAILIGEEIAGILGIIFSVFGVIIPPIFVIILAGSIIGKYSTQLKGFFEGVYASIIGLVAGVLFSVIKVQKWNVVKVIILIISIVLSMFFRKLIIMLFVLMVGWCLYDRRCSRVNKRR